MTTYCTAFAIWAVSLVLAFFYARRAKHPQTHLLAVYLIFVTIFTASSVVLFSILSFLLHAAGQAGMLNDPLVATLFLIAVFLPGVLFARWQLRKPPWRPQVPT
jgi:hypothetical protein